jgi:hypothetical protein
MNIPFDLAHFDKIVSQFREYFFLQIISWAMLIQLGNKCGSINFLGTRYTSVVTREGKEHLCGCGSTTPKMASVLSRATCIGTSGRNFGSTTLDSLPPKRRHNITPAGINGPLVKAALALSLAF